MTTFYRYIVIFLFVVVLPQNLKAYAEGENPGNKLANYYLPLQIYHFQHSNINKLMEVLDIKPGMTVLDIGTGTGQYAYKIAEELRGTGKIYATDVNIELINYVTEEASRRGLSNIYPVLVAKNGVDEFYFKQNYDLILVFHLYFAIRDRGDYFKKMKNLLNKNGRLIVTYRQCFSQFSSEDFTDFNGLIKELKSEPETSPFTKGLRESTRELVKQNSNEITNDRLKNAIVDDFNRMRSDRYFWEEFLTDALTLKQDISFSSEEEKNFVAWLLLRLNKEINTVEIARIEILNKLFIVQRFRKYLYQGAGITPYRAQEQCDKVLQTKSEFKKAGYKFEKEFYSVLYEYGLVFTAAINENEE